jgi:galactokinase
MPLDLGVAIAGGRLPGMSATVEIWSEAFQEKAAFSLNHITREPDSWTNYPRGVIQELLRANVPLKGVRLAVAASLPMGVGVASSAALTVALAECLYGLHVRPRAGVLDEARLCQRAEVSFVGKPCGLLDGLSSRVGKKDHVLFLDGATFRYQQVPLGRDDLRVVVLHAGSDPASAESKRAWQQASWERAAREFSGLLERDVRFLRDVSIQEFEKFRDEIDAEDLPCAEHAIRENERVLRGFAALKVKLFEELRRLMHASGK